MIKVEVPIVLQEGAKDCGLASLLMILKYYNGNCSLEYLKSIVELENDGLSMYSLLLLGNKIGFSCKGVKGSYLELEKEMLPCIANVKTKKNYFHYIVIYKIDKKQRKITVADPSKGLRTLSFLDFDKIKTDNYLLLKLVKNPIQINSRSKIVDILFTYLKENSKLIIYLICLSFFISVLTIVYSFKLESIIEFSLKNNSYPNLLALTLLFLIILLLKEISIYYKNHLINYFFCTISQKIITTIYGKLLSLSRLYYKNHSTGEIIARIQDMEVVINFIVNLLVSLITDTIILIIGLLTLFYLNNNLTAIVLTSITIYIALNLLNHYNIKFYLEKIKQSNSKICSFLTESIRGIESIKNLCLESSFLERFNRLYNRYSQEVYIFQNIVIKKGTYQELLNSCGELIIIAVGTALTFDFKMTWSTLITYLALLGYIYIPVKNQMELLNNYYDSKISCKRINEFLLIESKKKRRKNIKLEGNIKINNLSYSYYDFLCLNDINIEIKKGERILISGKSGSGKSTFAKILVGVLPSKRNTVFIDGIDILDIDSTNLKQTFSYISQNELLFTDTLYNNIVLYRNVLYEDFLRVCKDVLLDSVVSKNDLAYDMLIEEDGYNISGGEKARVILARSLLKKSEVYILDEIFSAIDINRERTILKNIFSRLSGKTIIVISHRFYNEDLFDRKLVLDSSGIHDK